MDINYEQILTIVIALLGYLLAYLKARETEDVQNFFDPESSVVVPPKNTPRRSYRMSPEVEEFLLTGESLADQAEMIRQIDEAEAAGKVEYSISYSKGYYRIKYGQIAGGAKGV